MSRSHTACRTAAQSVRRSANVQTGSQRRVAVSARQCADDVPVIPAEAIATLAGLQRVPPAVQRGQTPPGVQEGKLCNVWPCSTDITVSRARGCYIWADDGRGPFLDLTAGIAVVNTGHCHPHVTAAIQEQAERILHAQINNYHHPGLHELARRLGAYLPPGMDTIYYDNTGTQAIEAAVKLARLHRQRPNMITLLGGMHGRSTMCSSLTSNASIRNPPYTPLPSGVYNAPFPNAFRWKVSEEEAVSRALSAMQDLLKGQVRPDSVAAIIMEPVLGEGGFYPLPRSYVSGLKELLRPHGILYISDEIQAGYGRTGKMWGADNHIDIWQPDIIAASKGIASGLPLSMVASTDEIMQAFSPGMHGGTFNGNAVAVAAALATLDVFEEEGLIENSHRQGDLFKDMLTAVWQELQPTGDVRGHGLMLAVECCDENGRSDPACAKFIKEHCRQNANILIYSPTGFDGNILRLMPPLVIQEHEVVRAAGAIEAALRAWSAQRQRPAASA
eukprot:TRINITY_DN758_c0_g1_i1.p1 TRINITY_DN758_c0_g1~~TRINITY_DN758_c0_g1_i1.p1  ORF type:complete len:503 (+),score=133.11 TRINITY_DN758_c0_g1_i1:99-1607(+)